MEQSRDTIAERAARCRAKLRNPHAASAPVLPEGYPRSVRLEATGQLRRVPLAQTLATFGLDWNTCLATSDRLACNEPVHITLPNVGDGPLAIVILAGVGVQTTFESGC